jgi:hypothetical protein
MPRFKVRMGYVGPVVATVEAANEEEARDRVATSRKLDPGDLKSEQVRERMWLTCVDCGYKFKGVPTFRPEWAVCTACECMRSARKHERMSQHMREKAREIREARLAKRGG